MAEPAIEAGFRALGELRMVDINPLLAFAHPPPCVFPVVEAILLILEMPTQNTGVIDNGELWRAFKSKKSLFLNLREFRGDKIPQSSLDRLSALTSAESFSPDFIRERNVAAAGLCSWVLGMKIYAEIHNTTSPLQNRISTNEFDISCLESMTHRLQFKL